MRIVNERPEARWTPEAIAKEFKESYGIEFSTNVFKEMLDEMVLRGKLVKVDGSYKRT